MIWMLAGLAQAQDDIVRGGDAPALNAQLFRPSIDSRNMLWTDESTAGGNKDTSFRGALHYMNDPLVYTYADGTREELVSGVWQLSLLAGHTRGPVRIGVDLPVYLRSMGEAAGGETGLGDVALDGRLTAWDRYERPVGIAVAGRVGFPTATVEAPLGASGIGWEAALIVDRQINDQLLLAANIGTRGLDSVETENVEWDDQFFLRLGGGYAIDDLTTVSLDLASQFTYGGSSSEARPVEGLVGGARRLGAESPFVVRGGLGTGLNSGIGAPKFRAVAAIAYELPGERDRDGDGLLDREDDCRDEAEDLDGIKDDDGCPDPTRVVVEVYDRRLQPVDDATWTLEGAESAEGRSFQSDDVFGGAFRLTVESEAYGQIVQEVQIPDDRVHTIRVELGVPMGKLTVIANTPGGKPIAGAVWRSSATNYNQVETGDAFALAPGSYDLVVSAPGFQATETSARVVSLKDDTLVVTLERSRARLVGSQIEISDSVYFESGSATIKSESLPLLDEVAQVLKSHAELTKIRIEGHTDSRGGAQGNKDLSQERAGAVLDYLVSQGIAAERLEAIGYGEERPLLKEESIEAHDQNRRVDFFIVDEAAPE